MDQIEEFGDERISGPCAYCGRRPDTRDHVPSRVLLDEPYPTNLPVVPACRPCNERFSADEEYVACLLACASAGSVEAAGAKRPKVGRIFAERPALAARLKAARSVDDTAFGVEWDRVQNVLTKLAQGHALYELNEAPHVPPTRLQHAPLALLTEDQRRAFEGLPEPSVWPEVNSRAMTRLARTGRIEWLEVQPGRYRYAAWTEGSAFVRIVLAEYLACEAEFA